MLNNEYALISLFKTVSKITGRKRLQKTVYLLQQAGVPYVEKFSYHHYGPYSSELQARINMLVDHGLLSETYDSKAYTYKITEEGSLFIEKYEEAFNNVFDLPRNTVNQLMGTNTSVLEMASTYAYLLEMGYQREKALTKASELKPYLVNVLDDAQVLYDSLK